MGESVSAITAEIGLMKATEQLAGMEMMAVNPVMRIIAPRFLAGVISMPLLAAMFSAIGIMGGQLIAVGLLGVDHGVFWSQMQAGVDFREVPASNGTYASLVALDIIAGAGTVGGTRRCGGRSIWATGFVGSTCRFTSQVQKLETVACRQRKVLMAIAA